MSMDCQQFERMLDELLDGTAAPAGRREAEEHLSSCERCRELDALVRDAGLALPDAPAELTRDVLERTSGSPCTQAHTLLCEQVDGTLHGVDAELLELHRNHCSDCAHLGTALIHLQEDLPALALADPGPKFVEQVMAATLPLDRRLARLGRRIRQGWERLTQRPRFAWEGGYVGALLLFLIFGMPASPFSAVPGEAWRWRRSTRCTRCRTLRWARFRTPSPDGASKHGMPPAGARCVPVASSARSWESVCVAPGWLPMGSSHTAWSWARRCCKGTWSRVYPS